MAQVEVDPTLEDVQSQMEKRLRRDTHIRTKRLSARTRPRKRSRTRRRKVRRVKAKAVATSDLR